MSEQELNLFEVAAETGLASAQPAPTPATPAESTEALRSPDLPATVQDALLAARRAPARAHAAAAPPLPERFPVADRIAVLRAQLAELPPATVVSTEPWFREEQPAEAKVTLLLALLEIARLEEVRLGQVQPFAPILLKKMGEAGRDPAVRADGTA